MVKQVFISHSSKDKKIVEYIIDLLENMGVPPKKIFCTSFQGYGIPLGENFLEIIKKEFEEKTLTILTLSNYFYQSPICLCEMGAAWVKSSICIPVLIPPLEFSTVKGVISQVQGLTINDRDKLDALYDKVREIFKINAFDYNRWERKRDRFICQVNSLLDYNAKSEAAPCNELYERTGILYVNQEDTEITNLSGELVRRGLPAGKEYILNTWKECSIEKERFDIIIKYVRDKLNKLPWIVRKVLYYHFSNKKLKLEQRGELLNCALEAAEDDYLIIDENLVILNLRDPQVKKAVESLNGLKYFLENARSEFHFCFEEVYDMCAKIESRKFWKVMQLI
ncbi:MAG: toll/interleukin-1 receptor domain-containing protein [Acetivibrionales bacterium]